METSILIVDDEANMRQLVDIYLSKEGFHVYQAASGREALELMERTSICVAIIDIMMPGMDGWTLCRSIKDSGDTGILMLSARTDVKDRIKGLNLGADDYLVKPFDPEELIARVRAITRRSSQAREDVPSSLILPEMKIFYETREVFVQNNTVDLTPTEYMILLLLAEHPKRIYTRENIVEQADRYEEWHDYRKVDTHIKNVRKKLQAAGLSYNPIKTVWGVGYAFQQIKEQNQ
ncbi:two-component system response regulator ResD [Sinobaca qinghaiensis]|uniref:Two-component system response regulator ResD n=1 Tax=Sinobaca qinghaiensis TaxID=342944 RepID=A0A419V8H1_9BACL|nr:response regulator transcription factor [Sinobaca qinghaiensis]RKD76258.1 two-component system response regulator ResD [Sinobaca qinghaiensis]